MSKFTFSKKNFAYPSLGFKKCNQLKEVEDKGASLDGHGWMTICIIDIPESDVEKIAKSYNTWYWYDSSDNDGWIVMPTYDPSTPSSIGFDYITEDQEMHDQEMLKEIAERSGVVLEYNQIEY